MTSLVISPTSAEELELILALLKRMNIPAKALTDEEKEDLGLGLLMLEAMDDTEVSRDAVMQKLGQQ